jgi:hypothetical protein
MSDDPMTQLESDTATERRAAVRAILKTRMVPHDRLRALADKYIAMRRGHGIVWDVMVLLGRLRAHDQIPWLIGHLTYRSPHLLGDRNIPPQKLFPAVAALIEIGAPSVSQLLQRLESHSDADTRIAVQTVLREVLGRFEAVQRVRRELSGTTNAMAEANLTAMLDELRRR